MMKRRSMLFACAAALSLVVSVPTLAQAQPLDTVNDISSGEVEQALASVEAALVEEAASASTTATEIAVVEENGTGVSVPRDPTDGVDLTIGATSVSIGLPALEGASTAVPLESGAITYPSSGGVANTVIPVIDGVQLLTTIASADAPTSFAYQIDVREGGSVRVLEDGSVMVADADGNPLMTAAKPWAVDADGISVPTHYEVHGSELVQIVEHSASDHTYPIVADPTYTYWWGGKTWVPANAVSVQQVAAALSTFVSAPAAAVVSAGLGLCNRAGRGIWVYWTWAGHVWCTGP